MSDSQVFSTDIDLRFEFPSCSFSVERSGDGLSLRLNGHRSVHRSSTLEGLRDQAHDSVCRVVHRWIEDEVWNLIDVAVSDAWSSVGDELLRGEVAS